MKVSIVTIVKNGMPFVAETLKSVISQTYKNIEYIVIDSRSTDGTVELLMTFQDELACLVTEKDEELLTLSIKVSR